MGPKPRQLRAIGARRTVSGAAAWSGWQAGPAVDQVQVDAELVQDLQHDVVDQIVDRLRVEVEPGHRRQDHGASREVTVKTMNRYDYLKLDTTF